MTTAPQNVPRRMKRFYREAAQEKQQVEAEYSGYSNADEAKYGSQREDRNSYNGDDYSGNLEAAFKKVDTIPTERKKDELESIPSMNYEDMHLDEKNSRELKQIGENELEEKLALFEIEKFKKEKKRMPTKDEASRLAESVYTQIKTEKVKEHEELSRREMRRQRHQKIDDENATPIPEIGNLEEKPRHMRRGERPSAQPPQQSHAPTGSIGAMGDIKDLLGEEADKKSIEKIDSEMDLGMDDFGGDELEDMEDMDFDLEGKKKKKKPI